MIRASRTLLLAAIALAGGSRPVRAQSRVELTLAATTDVHGRLRAWDYYADRPDPDRGLSRAATIVDSLRRAAPGRVVLVDAGDLLQGNPMTYVAARIDSARPSPVVAAMNVMRYDAAAVGNHEFNYGSSPRTPIASTVGVRSRGRRSSPERGSRSPSSASPIPARWSGIGIISAAA